jgi:hypothetical protein
MHFILVLILILGKKKNKSNFIDSAKNYLLSSLGGVNASKMNRPMCGGHYNTTDGKMVYILFSSSNFLFLCF